MLELYHYHFSTISQKVRLVLAYKGLAWNSHEINLLQGENFSPDYLKINPKAQVPVLRHDGHIITESTVINEYLDEVFPEPPLRPVEALHQAAMRLWVKDIDDNIAGAVATITFATVLRADHLQRPREEVLAEFQQITDPRVKQLSLSTYERGIEAPEVGVAFGIIQAFLQKLATSLAGQTWLVGEAFSLAECAVTPYLTRLEHLGLDFLWEDEGFEPLRQWISRTRNEPAYQSAVTDFTHPEQLAVFKQGGQQAVQHIKKLLAG